MSEAPERIWAVTKPDDISADILGDVYAQQVPDGMVGTPVEYVRADRIEELEAKLAKAEVLQEAQKLFNLYAVQVLMLGATVSRLENLESAWINLKTQAELTGGKDE